MRLAARLARLEQRSDRNTTDVAGHTEQELALLLCENVEGLGIDRDAFKADPASAVTAFFVGVWDVEGLLDRILPSIERAGFDWLQGF